MYYRNEIRDSSQIPRAESAKVGQLELNLGEGLIERLSVAKTIPDFWYLTIKSTGHLSRHSDLAIFPNSIVGIPT